MSIKSVLSLLVGTACITLSFPAFSYECSEVLKYGIWETHSQGAVNRTDQSFANNMCSRSNKSQDGSLSITGYGDGQYKSQSSESVCSNSSGSLRINNDWFDTVVTASRDVLKAWNECLKSDGTHATIMQGQNLSRYSIRLLRNDRIDTKDAANFVINPHPSCLRQGKVEFVGETIIGNCERNPNEETSITVNFDKGRPQQLYIPALRRDDPRPVSPPRITQISVPPDSSDGDSVPRRQRVWTVDFPIANPDRVGIGAMIYPRPLVYSPADFTMHDHVYTMPNVPDYRRATITFTFDKAARIADVMLIQHTNGVAEIEGFIGNDERSLRSMGRAHSSQGANLPNRDRFFSEGFPDTFKFERAAEGKVFQVHITRTTLSNGYAFYRLYPRNEAQQAIAQR